MIKMVYIIHEHTIEDLLVNSLNLRLVFIEFHLLHLDLKLCSFNVGSLFVFLFLVGLLFCLDSFELIKYVLIMQDSMRELIFEVILIQKLLNPVPNNRVLQNLINIGSLIRVSI